jgi:hypothetical protein
LICYFLLENKDYIYGNETIDSNNLVVFLKPLFSESNEKRDISVLFGRKTQMTDLLDLDIDF